MNPSDDGYWEVCFDGSFILGRRFRREITQWLLANCHSPTVVHRDDSRVTFRDHTDAMLCFVNYR